MVGTAAKMTVIVRIIVVILSKNPSFNDISDNYGILTLINEIGRYL